MANQVAHTLGCCIGINAYDAPGQMPPLSHCIADAKAISEVIADVGGWSIQVFDTQHQEDLKKFLRKFYAMIRVGESVSSVVLYVACHALQDRGEIYLVPGGAVLREGLKSVPLDCLKLSTVVEEVLAAARHAYERSGKQCGCLFLIDACRTDFGSSRSAVLAGGNVFDQPSRTNPEGGREWGPNVSFILSAARGSPAKEGGRGDQMGPFAEALRDHMSQPGKTISALHSDIQRAFRARKLSPIGNLICVNGEDLIFPDHAALASDDSDVSMTPAEVVEK